MNKTDLQFMLAYAEAYGLMQREFILVRTHILMNEDRNIFIKDCCDYSGEYEELFLEAYKIAKKLNRKEDVFNLMRNKGLNIWQSLRELGLPVLHSDFKRIENYNNK